MRVTSLGSGSSGNALLVEAGPRGRTRILIDAGLSSRILIERLQQAGTHPKQLQGVLVTHEHIDHVIGLPVLMKRYGIPAISASATLAALQHSFASGIWPVDTGALIPTAALAPLITNLASSENEGASLTGVDPSIVLPEVLPESGMLLSGEGKPVVSTIAMEPGSRRLI